MMETVPAKKYRPRRRPELSAEDELNIVESYTVKYMSQKRVAQRFRVTKSLVSNLVCEARKMPEKLEKKKDREELAQQKREAIMETVEAIQSAGKEIHNSMMVC